jgi:hypothetical protein
MDSRSSPAAPLILTAALPPALQQAADVLRGRMAPQAAMHAPAHLTLFRHLPGPAVADLLNDMRALAAGSTAPVGRLKVPVRWEGLWVAPLVAPALDALRADLADRWHGLLAPGDLAPPRLHLSLGPGANPPPSLPETEWRVPGLLLWQYGEACWTPLVACRFRR